MKKTHYRFLSTILLACASFACFVFFPSRAVFAQTGIVQPTTLEETKASVVGSDIILGASGERGCVDPCIARTDTLDVNMAGWIESISPRRVVISYEDPKMLGDESRIVPNSTSGVHTNGSSYYQQNGPYKWVYKRVLDTSMLAPGNYRFCVSGDGNAGTYLKLPAIPLDECATFSVPPPIYPVVCGSAEQNIKSNIGAGTYTGGQVNVRLKITNAEIKDGNLSFHYDIYVDKKTDAFKAGFVVHKDRVPGTPGTIIYTEADRQTTVASDGITTAILQGDVLVPVNGVNVNFDIDWHWSFEFTYNTYTGPKTSSLPGSASLPISACPGVITPSANFGLTGSLPVVKYRGETAAFTIWTTGCVGGFNGPVNNLRTTAGLPSGAGVVSFAPTQISSCASGNNSSQLLIPIPAGTALGTYTITIAGDGAPGTRTTTVQLTILAAPVVSVAIEPENAKILKGNTLAYKLIATLADGTTEDVTTSASFFAASPAIAGMAANSATGLAVGTTQITGSYLTGSLSDSTNLGVVDFTLVCPGPQSLYEGASKGVLFSLNTQGGFDDAVPFTVSGGGLTLSPVSGNMTSPWYNQAILVSGSAGVRNLIFALNYNGSYGVKTASCAVPITILPNLAGITLAPATASIPTGGSQDYTVTARYTDGSIKDVTFIANYASGNSGIAALSGRKATGIASGTTAILADYTENGVTKNDQAQLTVVAAPPTTPHSPVVSVTNATCGQIQVSWIKSSTGPAATGFRLYRSPNGPPGYAWSQVGGDLPLTTTSYTDTAPLNMSGLNYYAVTAFNASGESNKALAPGVAVITCGPDLSQSDKDITGAGLTISPTSACNGFDPVNIPSGIRPGTSVSFALNICNTGTSATLDIAPGQVITLRDQLANISNVTGLTCKKGDGSACQINNLSFTGSAPNETVSFRVSHPQGLKIGEYFTVTFTGKIPQVPQNRSLYRFKNLADIYLDGVFQKRIQTPYFFFINGSFVPEKQEIAP